ncbi:hypothetical protein [Hyphomicrobium sp. 2TAF46]|uniref:hypothetical protein n=1 Tax=Hyphomicrobium sp. 2TAF46 TaxID=3233019 RepID=UPI003F901060
MMAIDSLSSPHATALRLLRQARGESDGESTNTSNSTPDAFDKLFATKLDENDDSDQDLTYKPTAAPLTTASGSIVEPLTDEGGAFDQNGNPLPVVHRINWNGVEVARIYDSGAAMIAGGFDLSSLGWDGQTPDDEKDAAGKELTGMSLADRRFEKLIAFFATQA